MVMAPSLSVLSPFLLSLLIMCSYVGQVYGDDHHSFGVVSVDSLMPSAICSPPRVLQHGSHIPNTIKIVHRHGPCSPQGAGKHDHHQTLAHDSRRVASIQGRFSSATTSQSSNNVSLPVQFGSTGNYVATVGIGTPKKDQTVEIDTGSDVCWIQCRPCAVTCYDQQQPIFDPAASSSYRNVSCTSDVCGSLGSGGCSGGACVYSVEYADSTTTEGFLALDKLTLTTDDVFPSFVFGCGENNRGVLEGAAGLVGLGRSPYSLVSQTARKLGNAFSYCLPSTSSTPGHLTLGASLPSGALYTPMLSRTSLPTLYFIDLSGISVGGRRLPVLPTAFQAVGTIIDSGTVFSRLPPSAYSALRSAFRSAMSQYPLAQPVGILDTCYDFSNVGTVSYPQVTLHYDGVDVALGSAGVFFAFDASQVCLAFAGSEDDGQVGIVGNTQQLALEVNYDIDAKRIGFATGTCS